MTYRDLSAAIGKIIDSGWKFLTDVGGIALEKPYRPTF